MTVGLLITLLGMAIVFAFIGILAVCIRLLEHFRSEDVVPAPGGPDHTLPVTAVIAAAIHAHRSRTKRM
jgi:Na+-transporting methylmalonyl-CoA/oxaloacetate decarboxylase gamma subunit